MVAVVATLTRTCRKCGETKPYTDEHYRIGNGHVCRKCCTKDNGAYRRRVSAELQPAREAAREARRAEALARKCRIRDERARYQRGRDLYAAAALCQCECGNEKAVLGHPPLKVRYAETCARCAFLDGVDGAHVIAAMRIIPPPITIDALEDALEVGYRTIWWHLKRLVTSGRVIERLEESFPEFGGDGKRDGDRPVYYLRSES